MVRGYRIAALLAACCIASSSAQGGLNVRRGTDATTPVSRIIGYYDANSQKDLQVDDVQHSSLTHVVLLNAVKVDKKGNLKGRRARHPWERDAADLITSLAAKSPRLIISLRGYPDDVAFDELTEKGRAPKFAEGIADTLDLWGADGIEVEWHADDRDGHKRKNAPFDDEEEQHIEMFASALGNALRHREKKTLSFAVRPKRMEFRTGEFVSKNIDWLSLRAFSMRTIGDPHHASMKDAREALDEWTERGVPRSKLVLDVPLFARPGAALRKGRDENLRRPWHEIAGDPGHKAHHHSYARLDDTRGDIFVDQSTGKAWFASGINTTMAKTRLVLAEGYGGVGFRALHHDALTADLSLVQAAGKAVQQYDEEVFEAAKQKKEADGKAWLEVDEVGLVQRWFKPSKRGITVDMRDEF